MLGQATLITALRKLLVIPVASMKTEAPWQLDHLSTSLDIYHRGWGAGRSRDAAWRVLSECISRHTCKTSLHGRFPPGPKRFSGDSPAGPFGFLPPLLVGCSE